MHITQSDNIQNAYKGEVEFIIKDRHGRKLDAIRQNNIIKISAKEILSHRLTPNKVWDPSGESGNGAWVTHDIDIDEYAPRYIILGASFDVDGNPLDTADTRFYIEDTITGSFMPRSLNVGADNDGDIINAIPIAEPNRPLKRIERVYYEPTYQPAGTPLLEDDVRALNNIVVFETTLRIDEYNGLGLTSSDFFTITEVALVGAAEVGSVGACECTPKEIFTTGSSNGDAFLASASGSATISLDSSETEVDLISEGDQIKIVEAGSTATESSSILGQVNPYYLVINKAEGGKDITLDRTPTDNNGTPITGDIGVFRDGMRIFSHRLLSAPVKKSEAVEIVIRWRIILN